MANTQSLDLELSSSQYASISDASQTGLDITGDISLEAWIKLEQLPSTPASAFSIITKFDTNSQRSYRLAIDTANKLTFIFSQDGGAVNFTTATATSATFAGGDVGVWVHVAVTVDVSAGASGITFYKNGSTIADTDVANAATSIFNGTAPFAIGTRFSTGTAGEFFDGLIDEVRVWNDIRSGAEILANMSKSSLRFTTGVDNLIDCWGLDGVYTSRSGNNTLTASGSPVFSTDVPFVDPDGGGFYYMSS